MSMIRMGTLFEQMTLLQTQAQNIPLISLVIPLKLRLLSMELVLRKIPTMTRMAM